MGSLTTLVSGTQTAVLAVGSVSPQALRNKENVRVARRFLFARKADKKHLVAVSMAIFLKDEVGE